MRHAARITACLLGLLLTGVAQEPAAGTSIDSLTVGDTTYRQVQVRSVSARTVMITHTVQLDPYRNPDSEPSPKMEMVGTILDLFFNLSSTSGNWSMDELIQFQKQVGLKFKKVNKFLSLPGFVQVIAQKI